MTDEPISTSLDMLFHPYNFFTVKKCILLLLQLRKCCQLLLLLVFFSFDHIVVVVVAVYQIPFSFKLYIKLQEKLNLKHFFCISQIIMNKNTKKLLL
jgi:hypothetical protein